MDSLEERVNENMKLKVLSYNIKDGFYNSLFQNPNPQYQSEREKLAKKVVSEYNPDVLVLPEACSYRENTKTDRVQDYQKIFGKKNFPFVGYADMFQDGIFGVAVLSKYPMTTEDLSDHGRALVRSYIDLPNNRRITLDGLHLMPSEKNRNGCNSKDKAKWLRGKIEKVQTPYILAGDFNGLSPQDTYDRNKMLKGFNSLPWIKPDVSSWIVDDLLKSEEIKQVLSKGMIDSYKKVQAKQDYTLPTNLNGSTTDSASRVDYVFCSADIKVKDAGIIKSESAEMASDHYPVFAELEF